MLVKVLLYPGHSIANSSYSHIQLDMYNVEDVSLLIKTPSSILMSVKNISYKLYLHRYHIPLNPFTWECVKEDVDCPRTGYDL